MIYAGKYLTLELGEANKTRTSCNLTISITRKNLRYYNREGINVYYEEYIDGTWLNQETINTWFTAYDPKGYEVPDSDNPVIADSYFTMKEIAMDNESITDGKRYGSRMIRVTLIENGGDEEELIQGTILIKTLELPLPVTNLLEVKTLGQNIYVHFQGVNPNNAYKLVILSNVQTTPIVEAYTAEEEIYIPITEELYNQTYLFSAYYLMGDAVLDDIRTTYTAPTFGLGLHFKNGTEWSQVNSAYKKVNGVWRKIVATYQKIGGEWLSRE